MATQDVFYPTGFSLTELTASINTIPHLPSMLGDSGLFSYSGVATLTVQLEKQGNTLNLVGTKPRGSAGQPIGRNTRDLRSFVIPHIPLDDAVYADEVQGVRLFGTESQATPLQRRIMEVMTLGKQRLDYTLEYHRVGALKGIVYDADGSTVLWNLFTEFGVSQNTLDFELDVSTTDVRVKCDAAMNLIDDELGGVSYTGAIAYCGRTFWQSFISQKSVKDAYVALANAAKLTGRTVDAFEFGGITWVKYRGKANGSDMIGTNDAYIVPQGVPDLLIGRFGPADYIETVNTVGLPIYAKGMEMPNGKGWNVEMQSNPIHLCTRPRAIIKATV